MRKRISLKTRRPDLSRREFRTYYEGVHVPLGLTFVDRFRWRRYRRNHVLSSFGAPIGFDCYAEFWVDEEDDDSALEAFVKSPEFQVLNDDDERFLDVSQRASFDMRETPLARASGDDEIRATLAVLVTGGPRRTESDEALAARLVESLGARVVEATLETRVGDAPTGPPPRAPFDTLIRLGLADERPVRIDPSILAAEHYSVLSLDPIETPDSLLCAQTGA